MIYRIFAEKDTFITNSQVRRVQKTGSNCGGSETLDVYKISGISGAIGVVGTASLARILLYFNLGEISSLMSSGMLQSNSALYYLKLNHATTDKTLPSSFDVDIVAVSQSWDEGRGLDVDTFLDSGYCNWIKAKSNSYWTVPGGDFVTTNSASYHFDTGYENIELDITNLVNSWLSGTVVNNGLMIKLTSSLESSADYTDYYIKRFYGRTSNFKDRRPYLEIRSADALRDDRDNFYWNRTGSLFLYNRVGGQLQNLSIGSNSLIVRIADASGTLLSVTASYTGRTGVYSASFALPTGSYSGSVFYDRWGSGSFAFMTSSFMLKNVTGLDSVQQKLYNSIIKNLKNEYDVSEQPRLNVLFRTRDVNVSFISSASLSLEKKILEKCYFGVENDSTRERVVQFGTGAVEFTKLSYDENGNYFTLFMNNFHPGNVYRILFLIDEDGQRQIVDCNHKFKVV